MSNTPARVPFTRVQSVATVQDFAGVGKALSTTDDNLQRLERNLNGVFTVLSLVAARSPYTVKGNEWLILCDCTAGAITLTFPLAARIDGAEIRVVKTDASTNQVTLTATISGVLNPVLPVQFAELTIDAGNGVYYAQGTRPLVGVRYRITTDNRFRVTTTGASRITTLGG